MNRAQPLAMRYYYPRGAWWHIRWHMPLHAAPDAGTSAAAARSARAAARRRLAPRAARAPAACRSRTAAGGGPGRRAAGARWPAGAAPSGPQTRAAPARRAAPPLPPATSPAGCTTRLAPARAPAQHPFRPHQALCAGNAHIVAACGAAAGSAAACRKGRGWDACNAWQTPHPRLARPAHTGTQRPGRGLRHGGTLTLCRAPAG